MEHQHKQELSFKKQD